MGLGDDINKAVNNVKDSFNEAKHRTVAEQEQADRDVAGDAMTPGEKASSVLNQAKNDAQADISAGKRDLNKL